MPEDQQLVWWHLSYSAVTPEFLQELSEYPELQTFDAQTHYINQHFSDWSWSTVARRENLLLFLASIKKNSRQPAPVLFTGVPDRLTPITEL